MTRAELAIVEFLLTSGVTELDDLPDWLLAAIEADGEDTMSHELITAASLLFARRQQPGIGFGAARRFLADYAADPVKNQGLVERINAFRLSCCLERLRRSGKLAKISIGDPFEPDSQVSVTLTEADWRLLNSDPDADAMQLFRRSRWSMN